MSSWKIVTCVGLLVSLISISKQGCSDYFNMSKWTKNNLMESYHLVLATDPNDIIACTLERACQEHNLLCHLQHCFNDDAVKETERRLTCKNESFHNISFYHLHCLVARATTDVIVPEGCNYDNVCNLYSVISPHDPTTTLPPTTTTTTTTIQSTTAAELRPAAVAVTANSSITTAATTAPVQGDAGKLNVEERGSTDAAFFNLQPFFIISLIINALLLGVVVMQWWRMRPTDMRGNGDLRESANVEENADVGLMINVDLQE